MQINAEQLKKFIVESGLVSKVDISSAEKTVAEKGGKLGEVLVSDGKLKSTDLKRIEAYVLGIPFVHLATEKVDFATLTLIPEPIARTNNIVAFKKTATELEVAMLDVDDLPTIDFIKKKTRLRIIPCLTDEESIKGVLQQYKKSLKAEFEDIIQKETSSIKAITEKEGGEETEKDLKELAEDLPIIKIVDSVI
jgi:type IV pilus assembly protein PilB